jgi:hypothetical protein
MQGKKRTCTCLADLTCYFACEQAAISTSGACVTLNQKNFHYDLTNHGCMISKPDSAILPNKSHGQITAACVLSENGYGRLVENLK